MLVGQIFTLHICRNIWPPDTAELSTACVIFYRVAVTTALGLVAGKESVA